MAKWRVGLAMIAPDWDRLEGLELACYLRMNGYAAHDVGSAELVNFRIDLSHVSGTVAEYDACGFDSELLAKPRGRIMSQLVRVP